MDILCYLPVLVRLPVYLRDSPNVLRTHRIGCSCLIQFHKQCSASENISIIILHICCYGGANFCYSLWPCLLLCLRCPLIFFGPFSLFSTWGEHENIYLKLKTITPQRFVRFDGRLRIEYYLSNRLYLKNVRIRLKINVNKIKTLVIPSSAVWLF